MCGSARFLLEVQDFSHTVVFVGPSVDRIESVEEQETNFVCKSVLNNLSLGMFILKVSCIISKGAYCLVSGQVTV